MVPLRLAAGMAAIALCHGVADTRLDLRDVKVLTFFSEHTSRTLRAPAAPQLQCTENCQATKGALRSANCFRKTDFGEGHAAAGMPRLASEVRWECEGFGDTTALVFQRVDCEGWRHADDIEVVRGSCRLLYKYDALGYWASEALEAGKALLAKLGRALGHLADSPRGDGAAEGAAPTAWGCSSPPPSRAPCSPCASSASRTKRGPAPRAPATRPRGRRPGPPPGPRRPARPPGARCATRGRWSLAGDAPDIAVQTQRRSRRRGSAASVVPYIW